MFSFLVPVQNYPVEPLVRALREQARGVGIDFEVCVAEDGSAPEAVQANSVISQWPEAVHLISEADIGRAGIRNFLADRAQGDTLVFIDADSEIPAGYVERWLAVAQKPVVVGGTSYSAELDDSTYSLRWTYGRAREEVPASERNGYKSFTANNVLIAKSVFERVRFDERITEYGHEDTLFGIALNQAEIPIFHLDNPVIHIGLEPNARFLEKTRTGIRTLVSLERAGKLRAADVKLLGFAKRLSQLGVTPLLRWISGWILPRLEKRLMSAQPRLREFDLYKLLWLIRFRA